MVLRTALHNFIATYESGTEDLNTKSKNLRNDLSTDSTAETSGNLVQGNSTGTSTGTSAYLT